MVIGDFYGFVDENVTQEHMLRNKTISSYLKGILISFKIFRMLNVFTIHNKDAFHFVEQSSKVMQSVLGKGYSPVLHSILLTFMLRVPGLLKQYDVYGNLFGLLAAHPVTPLVSLHHLDVVEPIFPNVTRVQALQRLTIPMKLDSAGLMQQSICYDRSKSWTVSVSWGFAVQIFRGIFSPREMEMPSRTFLNWYKRADYTAYAFNTRPVSRNPCQKPFVFYFSKAQQNSTLQQTVTEYDRHRVPHPECRWKMADPSSLEKVTVYKKPDPHLWERAPRRNCCRVRKSTTKKGTMVIDVGECREDELSEA